MKPTHRSPLRHEQGSTLLVALVILVALSFIGGLALTRTHFEIKLSHNDKILTRLQARCSAVGLTAAQQLEILSISIPDRLKDSDWSSTTRKHWLSRGENNSANDAGKSRNDRDKNILDELYDPDTWVTEEENQANGGTGPNSAGFEDLVAIDDEEEEKTYLKNFLDCEFRVIDSGTAAGSSLEIGNDSKTMHEYYVAAYCPDEPQYRIVQLGYRARH